MIFTIKKFYSILQNFSVKIKKYNGLINYKRIKQNSNEKFKYFKLLYKINN